VPAKIGKTSISLSLAVRLLFVEAWTWNKESVVFSWCQLWTCNLFNITSISPFIVMFSFILVWLSDIYNWGQRELNISWSKYHKTWIFIFSFQTWIWFTCLSSKEDAFFLSFSSGNMVNVTTRRMSLAFWHFRTENI
jgi:hypothetical protein